MKKLIIIMLIMGGALNTFAQVQTKVLPVNKAYETHPKFKISQKKSPLLKMPEFNIASMLAEDEAVKGMDVPFRFGKGFDVNYSLKDGIWQTTNDGRVWSFSVQSKGAYSINFVFSELFLPIGGELYIFNDEATMVYGPVTNKQNLKKGVFLTDLIQGEKVTIHIFEPSDSKEKTKLRIQRIVHAYHDTFNGKSLGAGTAEYCHNNIDCSPNWVDKSDAVALILFSNGTEHCTGSLLNNTANDYTPYILTAFHCIDIDPKNGIVSATEITDAENWLFKFGFRINDCGGMNYTAITYNNGANYHSGWDDSDFALLEMNDSPVGNCNITFLPWDKSDNTPTSGTTIHHPSGDYMKISF